jgi:hypothetical protein
VPGNLLLAEHGNGSVLAFANTEDSADSVSVYVDSGEFQTCEHLVRHTGWFSALLHLRDEDSHATLQLQAILMHIGFDEMGEQSFPEVTPMKKFALRMLLQSLQWREC